MAKTRTEAMENLLAEIAAGMPKVQAPPMKNVQVHRFHEAQRRASEVLAMPADGAAA